MGAKLSSSELLKAIAASGYFERNSFDPSVLCLLVEDKLNLGRDRAIDLLVKDGLVKFEYENFENLGARDTLDHWKLVLTENGRKHLSEKPL